MDDERYEDAIKYALTALPADGDFFWRHGWSALNTRKLLATLAGAAQRSAFEAQLEPNENASIQSVAFDPTGTRIVAASQSGKVSIWDSAARRKTMTCVQTDAFRDAQLNRADNSTDWVRDSRFGETQERVLSTGTHGAWIWSPTCKQCDPDDTITCLPLVRMREADHTKDFRTGTFSPDWKNVVTTSDDGTVKEWDAHDGKLRGPIELPPPALPPAYSYTTDAAYSRDGKSIAISRRDGLLAIVNTDTRETKILQLSGPAVRSVQFDRSGKRVLSASANGEIAIWDISSGTRVSLPKQNTGVGKASFSPDEKFVLTTSIDGVARLKAAPEFTGLAQSTRRAYFTYIKLIEDEFGDLPLAALADRRVRGEFKEWRDKFGNTPRKADFAWTVLARILSFGKDRGIITVNPCERGGRLYSGNRRDKVWSEENITSLLSIAPKEMQLALMLAIWTGQRQGDLLRLP